MSNFMTRSGSGLEASARGRPAGTGLGPDGRHLTEADLPDPSTKRWVMRRKATVVAAVRSGLLSLEEACDRYQLSVEEFVSWQRLIDRHGVRGLRATRVQHYRSQEEGESPMRARDFQTAE